MAFKRAEKKLAKLRAQLVGPSGSGKTWTALELASELVKKIGGRIALIDSERGSASKYADRFDFDVQNLEDSFDPKHYVSAIKEAEAQGYSVVIVDSMSHEWVGTGGVLEKVDIAGGSNKWAGWRVGTPAHNAFIDAMLQSKCHLIATARAKTEWVLEPGSNGRMVPRAVGVGAVQRDGVEYEFDVAVQLDVQHVGTVTKTRAPALDGKVLRAPGPELAAALLGWLETSPVPAAAGSNPPPAEPPATGGNGSVGAASPQAAEPGKAELSQAGATAGTNPASPDYAAEIERAIAAARDSQELMAVGLDAAKVLARAKKEGKPPPFIRDEMAKKYAAREQQLQAEERRAGAAA